MRQIKLMYPLLLSVMSVSVHAGSMSTSTDAMPCGSNAVTLGMTPEEIINTCGQKGEPAMVTEHVRPAVGEDVEHTEDVFEKWLYPTSDRRGNTHVVIKNGEVVKIFTTGR